MVCTTTFHPLTHECTHAHTQMQGSDSGVFVINMEEYEALSNGCVSASPSFSNITSESETSVFAIP